MRFAAGLTILLGTLCVDARGKAKEGTESKSVGAKYLAAGNFDKVVYAKYAAPLYQLPPLLLFCTIEYTFCPGS